MKIGLISCVSSKRKGKHKAKDLYTSAVFKKSVKYAEKYYDDYYILSAKYGLLNKNDVIEDYNLTLIKLYQKDRLKWALHTARMINNEFDKGTELYIMAGQFYREFLLKYINYKYTIMMEGLTIGRRMEWLDNNL